MNIKILTKNKKRLNVTLIISMILCITSWLIIFPWQLFVDTKSYVVPILMMFSTMALVIWILTGLISLMVQPKVT